MKNYSKVSSFNIILIVLFVIIAIAVLAFSAHLFLGHRKQSEIVYSDIIALFENNQVEEFVVKSDNTLVLQTKDVMNDDGTLKEKGMKISFKLRDINIFYNDLNKVYKEQGISYNFEPVEEKNSFVDVLLSWIP